MLGSYPNLPLRFLDAWQTDRRLRHFRDLLCPCW